MMQLWSELRRILDTMDVPHYRKVDLNWLNNNLGLLNKTHKDYARAMVLIRLLLQGEN